MRLTDWYTAAIKDKELKSPLERKHQLFTKPSENPCNVESSIIVTMELIIIMVRLPIRN